MPGELLTAITSLGGVALGGGLSYLAQSSSHRTAERTEQRRQDTARAESRRAERLTHLERFIAVAAEAERISFNRPTSWESGDSWHTAAQDTMNRLWVAERMIQVLYPPPVHAAARPYFEHLNQAVWAGVPTLDALYADLDTLRGTFLTTVRATLD